MIEICAWASSVAFSICGIPQAYLSFLQKHSDGVSWLFLLLWVIGQITGLVYAVAIEAYPLLLNYIISFICACIILVYKIKPCRVWKECKYDR